MEEKVTIKNGDTEYKIAVMNTIDGVGFSVRHQDLFEVKSKDAMTELVKEKVKNYDELFSLTTSLLGGAEVGGETCDDLGMCTLFRRRPAELFAAIVASIAVNFRDCFPFLLDPVDTPESHSPEQKTSDLG